MQTISSGSGQALTFAGILLIPFFLASELSFAGDARVKPDDVVFESEFDSPEQREAWSVAQFARWEDAYHNSTSLCVTVSRDYSDGSNMAINCLDCGV